MIRRPLRFLFVIAALAVASAASGSRAAPAPSGFAGTWTMEQIPPGGTPRQQGTLTITQNGNALAGRMRLNGTDVPLSNVSDNGGVISFSVPAPGRPGLVLTYSGAIQGNQLGVASQDLGNGSFTVTAQRAGGAPQAQAAQTAPAPTTPATPRAAAPAPPAARAPAAPQRPAAAAPRAPAAPPPTLGAPGTTAQGDYVTRLLGQVSPSAGPATPSAPPPDPPAVASAAPPAPAAQAATPVPAPRAVPPQPPPAEPPPAPGLSLEGSWNAEQTSPNSNGPNAAILNFVRNGSSLAGRLVSGGQEFPLFDVIQDRSTVSFSLVIPGTPYETVVYRGMLEDDRLEMAGLGEKQGVYNLTATRQGASAAAPARAASEQTPAEPAAPQVAVAPPPPAALPEPPPPATAPQIALAPPPPAASPGPPPPAPELRPPAASPSEAAPSLQGNWIAELMEPGSTSTIQAALSFDGDKATMRVGTEDLPLYDVTQLGHDLGFTVVVPGTPYVSVRYSGVVAEDMMQLTSLDEGRGVFSLLARRVDENAVPAAGPPTAQPASLLPPPARAQPPLPPTTQAAPPPPRAQTTPRLPSPASALPIPQTASLGPEPPAKLPLPELRDLPPNGLAPTPLMGWSSRQKLGSRMDDAAIRQSVEGLVESGLNLLGYIYVEIGDGWQGARDPQGVLHPNERFPDMKALGDYIHSQGLKFGLTTSAAPKSCNGFQGSYGHEAQDARTFAEWGVDYVVYEWCGAETIYPTQDEMRAAFQKMGEALRASGRDIVYGISQKGEFAVEQWASKTGANVWRSGSELEENWVSIASAGFGQDGKEISARPGAWNDPGLLQTGNGMTGDASRMQLNLWAVLAAPMMLGTDVRIMIRDTVALLSNRELIAVNQDKLGRQGQRVAQSGDAQVWAKPLADGSVAVAFFNTGARTTSVGVTWEQLGIEGSHLARDLWWHENLGIANESYRVVLAGGTSMLLKLSR